MKILVQSWHWGTTGFLISLVMFALLYQGKSFGLSSTYRTLCAIGGGGKVADFFNFRWQDQVWNLLFVVGIIAGGYIANSYLFDVSTIHINEKTVAFLSKAGFVSGIDQNNFTSLLPKELYGGSIRGLIIIIIGGILSGFGARYAGGCTSGHFVSGMANLQLPSLITLIFFMVAGIITSHFILPLLN